MNKRVLIQLGLGLWMANALVGCGGEEQPAQAKAGTIEPLFMLSADGVGPINPDTPFNLVRIGDAFQDLNVAQETHFNAGEQYPVITVKQQVKPLLSINPDYQEKNVFSVVVHDNLIGNKLGHTLGTPFKTIYPYDKTEQCAPGMEEWVGKVMCYAPQTGNILYLFGGQWNGPEGQIPPLEVLANWQLEAMVWKAPLRK